jgi:hypothetical protein
MLNRGEDLSHLTPEERRKYLKSKLRNKRDAPVTTIRNQLRNDPTGALLSMGIDDPAILASAKTLVKNPEAALANVKSMLANDSKCNLLPGEEEDDEDLPPAFPVC